MILLVCLAKTVRRIRKRLRLLLEKDLDKYMCSVVAYKGYFLQTGNMLKRMRSVI